MKVKLKLHQRRGILNHKPTFSKTITDPGELFSLVVGHWVLFATSPQQTFENFNLPSKSAILEFWIMSGWIVGTPTCWDVSKVIRDKVHAKGGHQKEAPKAQIVSLYHLVNQYRNLLKRKPSDVPNNGNVSALMRRLCKEYPSAFIEKCIIQLFQSNYPDYSMGQLKNVIEARYPAEKHRLSSLPNASQSLPGARRAI